MNQIVCLLQDVRRNSFRHQEQQKKSSSPSTSSQSSEDDFLSPPRTKTKPSPCYSRCAVSTATPTRTPFSGRARPSSSCGVREEKEEERQKWRKFRETKKPYRSAVFSLHPRKPRNNPSEPSEYSALAQLLFLTALRQLHPCLYLPVVLSSEGEDEGEDEGDGDREDVHGTSEPAQVGDPRLNFDP